MFSCIYGTGGGLCLVIFLGSVRGGYRSERRFQGRADGNELLVVLFLSRRTVRCSVIKIRKISKLRGVDVGVQYPCQNIDRSGII